MLHNASPSVSQYSRNHNVDLKMTPNDVWMLGKLTEFDRFDYDQEFDMTV